jgi:sensor c-di-GMP phosphodiesterase-like protein
VSPKRKLVVAMATGVVLAGPPVAAFNLWLNGFAERQGLEELASSARRNITLGEVRIQRAVGALNELAVRNVDSCRPQHIDALRQMTFAVPPVKEMSVVSPDGRTLCNDSGLTEPRTVISSEPLHATGDGDTLLEILRLGERPGRWVRVRKIGTNGANSLAALVPAEVFIPNTSSHGGPLANHARMTTRQGSLIAEGGKSLVEGDGVEAPVTTRVSSERYALSVSAALPRAAFAEMQGWLRMIGAVGSGVFALLILGAFFLIPRRATADNPIAELERALKAGEFVPYYQPIVDIRSGKLNGAEILVRWRKPDGSIVPPVSFIPLAESSGLIIELTRALMKRVRDEMSPSLGQRPHLKVSFNLTARHFTNEEIVDDVRKIFAKCPLKMSQLVFEVTERQPLENLTETRRVIAALQGLGARIAIDDVGTGHSGLSYMLKLGVDIIKIDKVFIDSLGTDRNSNTIIETLIDLAQNMRMDIVAEGVESFEQVVALRELGIRLAQGYVFAPPLPGAAFLQLVEAIDPLKAKPARKSLIPDDAEQEGGVDRLFA